MRGAARPDGRRADHDAAEGRCYDAAGRLTTMVSGKGSVDAAICTAATTVSRFEYAFDANGNRLSQGERRTAVGSTSVGAAEATMYGYDNLDRLIGVKYPDGTATLYRLDAVGNRTGERKTLASKVVALTVAAFAAVSPADASSDLSNTFNRADWLTVQADAKDASRNATLSYDLAGNLTQKTKATGTRTFAWDARGALASVSASGTELGRYDYDAAGMRVKRRTASETVEYILDDGHVLQEADGSTSSHSSYRRYHYGYGPLSVTDTNGKRFIQTDALGSPTDLTGTSGAIASIRKYDAWGSYRDATAPSSADEKLGYTGHQYDPETGLVYARARYYDPEVGAFISRDTYEGKVADAPSLHRFLYVRANPLRGTDPSGRLTALLPPRQDLIEREMAIRWEQYQNAETPEAKATALEYYQHWQGQLRERQDNDIFGEEITVNTGLPMVASAALGPVAAEVAPLRILLAAMGLKSGATEIKEGSQQGGQMGTARVVSGFATILASGAALLPEAAQGLSWLKGKLAGEKPAVTTVVEGQQAPATRAVEVKAPAAARAQPVAQPALVQRRSLGAAAADDPALGSGARTTSVEAGETVFRVQGGVPPNASKVRLKLGEDGKVEIAGDDMLFVNLGQEGRALEFLAKRGDTAELARLKVTPEFAAKLRAEAVPQRLGRKFPGRPQAVDATRAPDQFGIPASMFDEFLANVLSGSFTKGKL